MIDSISASASLTPLYTGERCVEYHPLVTDVITIHRIRTHSLMWESDYQLAFPG